jgi:hypothetical protein
MFEYFFAKKLNDRTRDQQLRELNTALGSKDVSYAGDNKDKVFGDAATSLPPSFLNRQSTASE